MKKRKQRKLTEAQRDAYERKVHVLCGCNPNDYWYALCPGCQAKRERKHES